MSRQNSPRDPRASQPLLGEDTPSTLSTAVQYGSQGAPNHHHAVRIDEARNTNHEVPEDVITAPTTPVADDTRPVTVPTDNTAPARNGMSSTKFGLSIAASLAALSATAFAVSAVSAETSHQDPFALTQATVNGLMINTICAACANGPLSLAAYSGLTAAVSGTLGTFGGLLHRFCGRNANTAAAAAVDAATLIDLRTGQDTNEPSAVSSVQASPRA